MYDIRWIYYFPTLKAGNLMAGTRIFISIILAAFLVFPLSGFGSEDPPKISLTTTCSTGLTVMTLRNTGGAMPEAGLFEAVFADGDGTRY